jgi:hypothetical protein
VAERLKIRGRVYAGGHNLPFNILGFQDSFDIVITCLDFSWYPTVGCGIANTVVFVSSAALVPSNIVELACVASGLSRLALDYVSFSDRSEHIWKLSSSFFASYRITAEDEENSFRTSQR